MPKHNHKPKHPKNKEEEINGIHDPFWMRAHRDWRFWVVVVLMLAAISTFVMTGR